MTVAAAIERKSSIVYDKLFLRNLIASSADANIRIENHNERLESSIEQLVAQTFGSKNAKVTKEEYASISEPYRKSRIAEIIDPIDIKAKIDKMEDDINEFETNIDNILTESNATTKITIPDN